MEGLKASHSKVRDNQYLDLEKPQQYISSKLFTNDQCFLIFALKSKTLRGVKTNTISAYQENYLCPLCERYPDTQEHIGLCRVLQDIKPLSFPIDYSDLSGTVQQQLNFIVKYEDYLSLRDENLSNQPDFQTSLPGLHTGPQLPQARIPARSKASDII